MITKYKLFEKYDNVDFYDDFFKKGIRYVDYYLNKIENLNIYRNDIKQLFHWSCMGKLNDFAYKISQKLNFNDLKNMINSLSDLDFETFQKIINERKLLNYLINDEGTIEYIISKGDIKKLKFLEKNGVKLNHEVLKLSCFYGRLEIVKYLVSKGLDPGKMTENFYSRKKENCLDETTKYGDNNFELVNYLVNELNIQVTYRHMHNVILKDNYDVFEILLKSDNLVDDYQINLIYVINLLISKNKINYVKILIKDKIDLAYSYLQALESKKYNYNGLVIEILKPDSLEVCYYVINKYNGRENGYTTIYITRGHKDYWMKKMKENPSIIKKLSNVDFIEDYDYQKMLLDIDEKNIKFIIDNVHPKIIDEYQHLPEIINLVAKKYNF